jgi:hypothetical protein
MPMKKWMTAWAAFVALTWAGSLGAHHSARMFEPFPHWVTGSFVDFARINPHSIVTLEETTAHGQIRRWAVEGASIPQLERRGIGPDFLNTGDVIAFCAFPMKEEFSSPSPGAPPFVHGQVVVMADGKMQIWGPYGAIRNCVRPDDQSQVWVDFLNSNDLAWTAWCVRFANAPTREDSKAVIDEVNSLMAKSCE